MMNTDWIPFGFLPLYKPTGPTSHDMVALARRLLPRKTKVGHMGTLDPFAAGVLLLGIGKATRFTDDVHKLAKVYRATLKLGVQTNTLDPTGVVSAEIPVPKFSRKTLASLVPRFRGERWQLPPIFSAKRVKGRKSYELARKNLAVDLAPKRIIIHDLQLRKEDARTVIIEASCSSGTYMRALGRDIAEALGTCGYLVRLERTAIGHIDLAACVPPQDLTAARLPGLMISVTSVLAHYPEVLLPLRAVDLLLRGRPFLAEETMPATFLGVFQEPSGAVEAIFRCEYENTTRLIHSRQLCFHKPLAPAGKMDGGSA